jgi:hypothetical protein
MPRIPRVGSTLDRIEYSPYARDGAAVPQMSSVESIFKALNGVQSQGVSDRWR